MSEDECIAILNIALKRSKEYFEKIGAHILLGNTEQQAIETILDLYKKEKDSNQWLLKAFDESRNNNIELSKEYCKIQKELQQEKEKTEELLKDREKSTKKYIHNNPWLYKQLSESYILKSDVDKNYINKEKLNETLDSYKYVNKNYISKEKLNEILNSYKYVKIPGMRQVIEEIEKKVLKEG